MTNFLSGIKECVIVQGKAWGELYFNWESAKQYKIYDSEKKILGSVIERKGGFFHTLKRLIFRSHRTLQLEIFDAENKNIASCERPFFFFLSHMIVKGEENKLYGSIHRRVTIFSKKYDLKDSSGNVFARVKAPFWNIWKFPIYDHLGNDIGEIDNRWSGALRELFSDADTFYVDLAKVKENVEHKILLLALSVAIDFDFFENKQR